jgi:Domain of unknown function DUF11
VVKTSYFSAMGLEDRVVRIVISALGLTVAALAIGGAPAVAASNADGLSIAIESPGAVTRQAGAMQYHVTATNTGAAAVGPLTIKVVLVREKELSWTSSTSSVACAPSHTVVGCSLPSLSAGESVYITIVAIVDATATGKVSATATVTGGGVSSSASATNVVDLRYPKPADLALTVKTASGGRQGARWTWRIFNLGPGAATKPVFEELSALGGPIVVATTNGTCAVTNQDGNRITCHLRTIPPRSSAFITVRCATFTESGVSIIEHPSVISDAADPRAANNVNGNAVKVLLRPSR